MARDPFEVLGVSPNATEDEIKTAYRRLAKRYHPDLNPGDASAAQKMNEVNAAYDQIKNPDAYRSQQQSNYSGGNPYGNPFSGYGNPFGSYGYGDQTSNEQDESAYQDPFEAFFGQNTGRTYYYYSNTDRSDEAPRYHVRRFSLIRILILFMLINFFFRACGEILAFPYYSRSSAGTSQSQSEEYSAPAESGQNRYPGDDYGRSGRR